MGSLTGKKIVLGVTGGIAAYKAVEIASRLRKAGAEVHVVMTREATEFVTELTFREITGQPVTVDMWAKVTNFNVEHIALANLADIMLIAPATANIIAKTAAGIADDMLTTTLLATKAPIIMAPAMNTNMYENPVTQKNIAELKSRGVQIIEPASGHLACGVEGKGRLPVTAAGTIEPLDPVRYLGNRSTGKMGYAIAAEAAKQGAEVLLVSGPSNLPDPAGVRTIRAMMNWYCIWNATRIFCMAWVSTRNGRFSWALRQKPAMWRNMQKRSWRRKIWISSSLMMYPPVMQALPWTITGCRFIPAMAAVKNIL